MKAVNVRNGEQYVATILQPELASMAHILQSFSQPMAALLTRLGQHTRVWSKELKHAAEHMLVLVVVPRSLANMSSPGLVLRMQSDFHSVVMKVA